MARRIRVVPPVYLLIAIILMAALLFVPHNQPMLPPPWRWFGIAPLAIGLWLGMHTVILFRKHQTTIKPGQISNRLVTQGPFCFTRNPIYLSMVLILAGIALFLGAFFPWLVLPVFIWVIDWRVIPVEEQMLEETFGPQYTDYRQKVRRWI